METQAIKINVITPIVLILIFSYIFSNYVSVLLGLNLGSFLSLALLLMRISKLGLSNYKVGRPEVIFLLFLIATSSSLLISQDYILILPNLLGYLILFTVIANLPLTTTFLLRILVWLLICISILALLVLVDIATNVEIGGLLGPSLVKYQFGIPVVVAGKENPNAAGAVFMIGPPICFLLLRLRQSPMSRISVVLCLALCLTCLTLTYSRSAIAGCVMSCTLILLISRESPRKIFSFGIKTTFIFAILFVFALLVYTAVTTNLTLNQQSASSGSVLGNKIESLSIRKELVRQFIPMLFENPISGVGYGNAKIVFGRITGQNISTHNIFIATSLEFGWVAGALFIATLYSATLGAFRRSKSRFGSDKLILASLASVATGMIFHGMFHEIYISSVFWLIVVLSINAGMPRNNPSHD